MASGSSSRVSEPFRKLWRRLASGHAPEAASAGGPVAFDVPRPDGFVEERLGLERGHDARAQRVARAGMSRAEVDDLEAVRLTGVRDDHEAVAAPDLVLHRLPGVGHPGLEPGPIRPVEVPRPEPPRRPPWPPRFQASIRSTLSLRFRPGCLTHHTSAGRIEPRGLAAPDRPFPDPARANVRRPSSPTPGRRPPASASACPVSPSRQPENGATGRLAPRSNSFRTAWRMAGRISASSSREARRSLTTFRMVGWWPILNPSEPVRRMNQDLSSSANAALSTEVVSTAGSPRAEAQLGQMGPPCRSGRRRIRNRIVVPTRRWMFRSAPFVSASRARAWALRSGNVGVDGRDEPGLAELAEHRATELRHFERRGAQRDEGLRAGLREALPVSPGDPLRQHGERAARLLVLGQRLPLALEHRERGRVEGKAGLEAAAQVFPGLGLGDGRLSTAVHSGGNCARRSKHQSAYAFDTFFRWRSWPASPNSRRRTTSLISVSSLAIRSLATRRITLVMRSCHCMSQSVISTWLRGRLTNRRAVGRGGGGDGEVLDEGVEGLGPSARCRFRKFRTSSKRSRTGPPAARKTRPIASVPGGVVFAAGPSSRTPCSPASCRARSSHGVSRPSRGSQALPTKAATLASGTAGTPRLPEQIGHPRIAASHRRRSWPSGTGRRGVCVLPPPNCVMRVMTGAVSVVRPASRRSTIPACSRSARVKQVRAKNCSGSR